MTARYGHHKVSFNNFQFMPPLATGGGSLYEHTVDLLCLNFCRPSRETIAPQLTIVSTTLHLDVWERVLSSHLDRAFARYVCLGLSHGFRIGFQHSSPLRSASSNMESARLHPEVISEYLRIECSLGRMLGPFPDDARGMPPLHVNRFGVIPKGHNTGKWRLITDLSFPPGFSVNDGIDPSLCSMVYTTVDEVVVLASRLGRGALLAKIDIESAYRLIPVHPQDRHLQATRWEGRVYVDPMLPFGLRSAPKIFNAVADAPAPVRYPHNPSLPGRLCHHRPPRLLPVSGVIGYTGQRV